MIRDTTPANVPGGDVRHRRHMLRGSVLLVLATAGAMTMTGCQKGSTAGGSAPTSPAEAIVADNPDPSGAPSQAGHPSVPVTENGYVYRVALDSNGISAVTSTTTSDGSGSGGTAIDATPGHTLLVATLSVTNSTDRPEPLPFVGLGPLPTSIGPVLSIVVPRRQAAAFGLQVSDQKAILGGTVAEGVCGDATTDAQGANPAPVGYCNLDAELAGFSPAQTDLTQPPQLAPGGQGSLTIVVQNSRLGAPVPETAPLPQARVAVASTTTASRWVELP